MIKRIINYIGDHKNAGKLKILLYITLIVVFAADFLVHREHAAFFWDHIPGWSAFYGFASCVILIVVAKGIGHNGIMKREDYYD